MLDLVALSVICLAVTSVTAVIVYKFMLGQPIKSGPWPIASPHSTPDDAFKNTAGIFALAAAVLTAAYSYRKQRLAEAESHRADAIEFSRRYSEALTQLGDNKPAIRLGGAYSMARLADDWPEQRQTCVDVLCAYLRMSLEPALESPAQGEKEVRSSIQRLIETHVNESESPSTSWSECRFDLSGSYLTDAQFARARFAKRVKFSNTTFTGESSFERASFLRSADFSGAKFEREASFHGCDFFGDATFKDGDFKESAIFTRVIFRERSSFEDALFSGEAYFGSAAFFRQAIFRGAGFRDAAAFRDAKFVQTASFENTDFKGVAMFREAEFFEGAEFDEAHFASNALLNGTSFYQYASFAKINFSGFTTFADAKFQGANFKESSFGKKASFNGSMFKEQTDFSFAKFLGASRFERVTFGRETIFTDTTFVTKPDVTNMINEGRPELSGVPFIDWPQGALLKPED
jgi:uncharacterized protein YjbI with pentapeptide repeats